MLPGFEPDCGFARGNRRNVGSIPILVFPVKFFSPRIFRDILATTCPVQEVASYNQIVFPEVFAMAFAWARIWLTSGAPGLTKIRERKGNCTMEPKGFKKGSFDIGINEFNEFLNELLCVVVIRLSREKVTLTFAALNVKCVVKKKDKKRNVNCSANMKRVGINTGLVLVLSL